MGIVECDSKRGGDRMCRATSVLSKINDVAAERAQFDLEVTIMMARMSGMNKRDCRY